MKDINCSAVITENRRKKGITQEELAAYLGVTKASVSKWETGISYPDIALFPVLAAYFDISIDCLMGYSPQMEKADIDKLYIRLALDFTTKPFEEVIAECKSIIKKYYSCYPLLYKISLLYINHAPMAADEEQTLQIVADAERLCGRVAENCKDKYLLWDAINLQAVCHLSLNNGDKVLELLGESVQDTSSDGILIAQAYQILGNEAKAQEVLQITLFGNLMMVFQSLMAILQNNLTRLETGEPVYRRAEALAELFNMKQLNPNNLAMMYLFGAQMYQSCGASEKALELLVKYTDLCIYGFFPVAIRGDEFFNKMDGWLAENTSVVPRSDAAVKNDMALYLHNPVFEPLRKYPEFERLVKRLKDFAEGRN